MSAFPKVDVMSDEGANAPLTPDRKRRRDMDDQMNEHLAKRQRCFIERWIGGADPKSQRPVHMNCDEIPNNSHSCSRDVALATADVGLKLFWLIMTTLKKMNLGTCPPLLRSRKKLGPRFRRLGHRFDKDHGEEFQREVWELTSELLLSPTGIAQFERQFIALAFDVGAK